MQRRLSEFDLFKWRVLSGHETPLKALKWKIKWLNEETMLYLKSVPRGKWGCDVAFCCKIVTNNVRDNTVNTLHITSGEEMRPRHWGFSSKTNETWETWEWVILRKKGKVCTSPPPLPHLEVHVVQTSCHLRCELLTALILTFPYSVTAD